jgi:hypothetical protein
MANSLVQPTTNNVASVGKYVYVKVLGQPFNQTDIFAGWILAAGINADAVEHKYKVIVYTELPGSETLFLVGHLLAGGIVTYWYCCRSRNKYPQAPLWRIHTPIVLQLTRP